MTIINYLTDLFLALPMFVRLTLPFILIISGVGTWRLYAKAGQPGYKILIPVVNIITLLKIIGRPTKHVWYLLIPGYNVYFLFRICIELCASFGKNSTSDKIFACVFNFMYILNLGLAYDTEYVGTTYEKSGATSDSASSNSNFEQERKLQFA